MRSSRRSAYVNLGKSESTRPAKGRGNGYNARVSCLDNLDSAQHTGTTMPYAQPAVHLHLHLGAINARAICSSSARFRRFRHFRRRRTRRLRQRERERTTATPGPFNGRDGTPQQGRTGGTHRRDTQEEHTTGGTHRRDTQEGHTVSRQRHFASEHDLLTARRRVHAHLSRSLLPVRGKHASHRLLKIDSA